jgi:glycosyltransferase involved in cell wall biosynthesis
VPCYNEQECIELFYTETAKVMEKAAGYTWTVFFIDDGSKDKSLFEIKKLITEKNAQNVKYISFSRNFGKEAAIYAGLQASRGGLVVMMDCDMQDPPSLLPKMLEGIAEGYDCVATNRANRSGEPVVRSFFANVFYSLMNKFSGVKMQPSARDYRMMTAQMRDAILSLEEYERFSKGLFSWVGFKVKWLVYENVERAAGITKWSFFKLVKYAVGGIAAFTTAPLRMASFVGFTTVIFAVAYALYRIIRWGWLVTTDSILIMLVLFFSGLIILFLGIIGEYIARMYNEVKRRPIYITKESNCGFPANGEQR